METFGNTVEKFSNMDNYQKASTLLGLVIGIVLIVILTLKQLGIVDYLSLAISKLTPNGFIALLAVLFIIIGGINFGSSS